MTGVITMCTLKFGVWTRYL